MSEHDHSSRMSTHNITTLTLTTVCSKEVDQFLKKRTFIFRSKDFVVAKVELVFRTTDSKTENLLPLKKAMKDGRLGSLEVDPDLKVSSKTASKLLIVFCSIFDR